jgi:hypothetical protein
MPVFASVQRTRACFGGQARLRRTTPPTCRKNRHGHHEMQWLEEGSRLFRPESAPIRARIL